MGLSRRQFLGAAAVAGAGSTFAPLRSLASVGEGDSGLAFGNASDVDPGFVAGRVEEIRGQRLIVRDLDSEMDSVTLDSSSVQWRSGTWNREAVATGDCIYARGERTQEGTLAVDRLWANIQAFPGVVADTSKEELRVRIENLNGQGGEATLRIAPQSEVQVPSSDFVEGDARSLVKDAPVQIIAFSTPGTNALTASRVLLLEADQLEADANTEDAAIPGTPGSGLAGCDKRTGLTTWFCCGNVSGCGRCGSSGPGACNVCRSDRRHMAWPKLRTGCGPFCGNCCIGGGFPRVFCNRQVILERPCPFFRATNVRVRDCGPTIRCPGPTGCTGRSKLKFDLTPCSFSILGNLERGIIGIDAFRC